MCPQATAVAAVIALGHWANWEIQFALLTQKYRNRGWECRGHLGPESKGGASRWLWRSLPAMGTVKWRYTSPVPPPLFVDAMQEVLDTRGWLAPANAEVAKRYLDQLWERSVEDPWDEWDAQWELYDEGADDTISYRAKLQGRLTAKEAKAQAEKEKRPKYAQGRRVTHGPWMLTAQQKADLDKQVAKTQKDMAKARARLRELRPKVTKTNAIFRASKRLAPHNKKTRKIRKLPPPSKPLERVKAITSITQEGNTLRAFTVALRGEVGGDSERRARSGCGWKSGPFVICYPIAAEGYAL